MLYRLQPHAPLQWAAPIPRDIIRLLDENDLPLDRLDEICDWQPATEQRVAGDDVLRVALRHGRTTSSALVVEAGHALDIGRADEIRRLNIEAETAGAKVRATSGGRLMEQLIPGWNAHGEELDAQIRQQTEESARDAESDLVAVLQAPLDPTLVQHWQHLGGRIPRADYA